MIKKIIGKVVGAKGQVVEEEFLGDKPEVYEVLTGEGGVRMQVYSSAGRDVFFCLALSGGEYASRGLKVAGTGQSLEVPVGKEVLGRVIDVFGEGVDGKGPVEAKLKWPIFRPVPGF